MSLHTAQVDAATPATAACPHCAALRSGLQPGADWQALLAHLATADYFEIFGLPPAFDVDEKQLAAVQRAIHRNIHPDRLPRGDEAAQAFALRASAIINQAFAALKDPVLRAEYLLARSGGKSASDDKQVPQGLLPQVMMIREELEEARASGDADTLARIKAGAVARRDETGGVIAGLCRELQSHGADMDTVRDALRMQLNAMKYHSNLVHELESSAAAKS